VSYATGSNIGAKPAEFLTYIRSLGTPRWISISNDGGRLEPGSKRPITITLASRSMPAGDYEANVAIHYSDNPDVRDMVIDVRMTVADAPDLAASWDAAAGYPA